MNSLKNSVKNRRVFYIPGYDPFPPRRYRELYRKEGAAQAEISNYSIALKGKTNGDGYGWNVVSLIDGQNTNAEIDVLIWSDIVKSSMKTGIAATYLQLFQTAYTYIRCGALRRLMWLRKGPIIAALYPVGLLLLQALCAVLMAWFIGSTLSSLIYPGVGWIAALPIIVLTLRWFRSIDRKFFGYYLMHDYAFTAKHNGAYSPELLERMAEFETRIIAALNSDVDEVLVVGHSSGAHLAVSILAEIEREYPQGAAQTNLAFLSLGQVIPMASFLPDAKRLRADLHDLSLSENITWVDVSAPGDGCSFAVCDPVAVSGVAPNGKRWPLVFSAAFTQTLSEDRWKELKRRYFRLHFQYLCAFDRPRDYDYFQITAGPITLADRYRDRQPSKSRIDVSASPYTSMGV